MKVLITGGAGYIGSALAVKLLHNGHSVISIDNLSRGDYMYLKRYQRNVNLKLAIGDICDQEKFEKIMKESGSVDAVVHLAAVPGLERCRKNPKGAVLTNVYGTYNVLEVARRYSVGRVIFTSSAAVYGKPNETPIDEKHPLNPTNLYGVTKLAGEKLVDTYHDSYGLSTVILRFGNVYGVGVYINWETVIPKFVRQALYRQPLTIYGDGQQSRDFIHVWDVIQAIELVLNAESKVVAGQTFNVATGKPTSINAIADTISRIFEEYNQLVKITYLAPREDEVYAQDFCLSSKKIQEKVGFQPKWDVEHGIRQIIRYSLNSSKRP